MLKIEMGTEMKLLLNLGKLLLLNDFQTDFFTKKNILL